jgi:methyltransferase (TIGR00027 family)
VFPGVQNSLVARARFIDDFAERLIEEGLQQLVILGAGYDFLAYRIEGLKKIRTFEVDHPATQSVKTAKIREIFGSIPEHVTYVSADLGTEDFGRRLMEQGYKRSEKTLFIMEGLLYYLPPHVVDEVLSFIAENSGKGSAIIFDYIHESSVDGIDARCGTTDGIIALTHFDIAAPSFGVGTCWAGFLTASARSWKPMQEALGLPQRRVISYAMMFGYPQHKAYRIPRRNPVQITWR